MQKYSDVVQNRLGIAVEGAKVRVTDINGSVATIYSNNGTNQQSNPMTTDANGRFAFYAADGRYNLTVTINNVQYGQQLDILLNDPVDPSPEKIDGGIITNSQVNSSEINDCEIDGSSLTNITIDGESPVKPSDFEYEGVLTPSASDDAIPAYKDGGPGGNDNDQAQALLNRMEWFKGIFDGPNDKGLTGFYAGGGWSGPDASSSNIYNTTGSVHTNATRQRFKLTESEASADPTVWLDKYTSMSRDDGVNRWDNGNIYAALHKTAGGAYGASITGVARHLGGTGDMIGIHGRGYGYHGNSKVWGGWFYAAARPATDGSTENVIDLIGIEINLNNQRGDISWTPAAGKGLYRGLIVNTADGSGTAHIGVDVGRQTSTNSKGWYVGYRVRADSIIPFDQPEGDQAAGILIEGAASLNNRYGGLCLRGAAFHYGIDLTGITTIDNNAAIVLKDDHRIRWGSRTSSRYISGNNPTGQINFNNYSIAVNGNKVIGDRQTGVEAMTGTPSGAAINTDTCTLQQLARYVKRLSDAGRAHGFWND